MAKTPAQRAAKHGNQAAPSARGLQPHPPGRTPPPGPGPGPGAGPGLRPADAAPGAVNPARSQGNPNLIVIAGVVASAFLFWYLHLLTLNQMTQLSGGRAMPDSLPGGFDLAYVGQLRAAMNADALGQLQFVHKTAATLFPLVFALTSIILIALNVADKTLRRTLWVPPLLFAIAAIWANFAVDGILSGPAPDTSQVALASTLVTASWLLLAVTVLAGAAALYLGRRRRKKPIAGTPSAGQQRRS